MLILQGETLSRNVPWRWNVCLRPLISTLLGRNWSYYVISATQYHLLTLFWHAGTWDHAHTRLSSQSCYDTPNQKSSFQHVNVIMLENESMFVSVGLSHSHDVFVCYFPAHGGAGGVVLSELCVLELLAVSVDRLTAQILVSPRFIIWFTLALAVTCGECGRTHPVDTMDTWPGPDQWPGTIPTRPHTTPHQSILIFCTQYFMIWNWRAH